MRIRPIQVDVTNYLGQNRYGSWNVESAYTDCCSANKDQQHVLFVTWTWFCSGQHATILFSARRINRLCIYSLTAENIYELVENYVKDQIFLIEFCRHLLSHTAYQPLGRFVCASPLSYMIVRICHWSARPIKCLIHVHCTSECISLHLWRLQDWVWEYTLPNPWQSYSSSLGLSVYLWNLYSVLPR